MVKQRNAKDLMNAIVIAMSVTILVVIAALVIASITENSVFTDIPTTGTNTNETLTALNATVPQTLAIISTASDASCSVTSLTNATGGEVIPTSNYTVVDADCTVVLIALSTYIDEDVNATYTYSYASGTSLAGVNVTKVTSDFGSFVTNLIAFLAVIGTILGVVWLVIYVRKLFDKKEGIANITA